MSKSYTPYYDNTKQIDRISKLQNLNLDVKKGIKYLFCKINNSCYNIILYIYR